MTRENIKAVNAKNLFQQFNNQETVQFTLRKSNSKSTNLSARPNPLKKRSWMIVLQIYINHPTSKSCRLNT